MNIKHPSFTVAQLNSPVRHPTPLQATLDRMNTQDVTTLDNIVSCDLTQDIKNLWLDWFLQSDSDSPNFHPSFTKSVASVRDDVEIALLKNCHNQIVGIFPYQRESNQTISPIGGRMNDFQSILTATNIRFKWNWLLSSLGANRFNYHAWTNPQQLESRFDFEKLTSYYIDLSDGIDNYLNWVRQHSTTIKRLPQKERSMSRRLGATRFEFDCRDPLVLEQLIEMKRAKFQRTSTFDILSVDWTVNLLRRIFHTNEDGFRGILSALWAGEHLVAAHFGMMHGNVLQYWFPAYNSEHSKFSPGLQLMVQSCAEAAKIGIDKIDMSYGKIPFKDKFCNRTSEVSIGQVEVNYFRHCMAKLRYSTRMKLKSIPFKEQIKIGLRRCFPHYGKQHFK